MPQVLETSVGAIHASEKSATLPIADIARTSGLRKHSTNEAFHFPITVNFVSIKSTEFPSTMSRKTRQGRLQMKTLNPCNAKSMCYGTIAVNVHGKIILAVLRGKYQS